MGKFFKRFVNSTQRKYHLLMLPKALREQAMATGEDPRAMRGIDVPKALQQVQNAAIKASDAYIFKPYSGKVVLFRAQHQRPAIYQDRTNGWGELASDLEIHVVPGHHGAIIREPRVGGLVAILNRCLEQMQAQEKTRRQRSSPPPTASTGGNPKASQS